MLGPVPRLPLLVLVIGIAALLALIPAGTASADWPDKGTLIFTEMELKASNGLQAHLEVTPDDEVTLELRREGQYVVYEVEGEATETGLKVRFGRLGLIDVAFTPTVTLDSTEPSKGCTGRPRTLHEGVFTGTIDFTGERGYVRLEGPQATGSMSVLPEWRCIDEPAFAFAGASRLLSHETEENGKESEHASLYAASRRCSCLFLAGMHHRDRKGRRGRSIFYGVEYERREGMEISRVTQAFGAPSDFVFNHEAGTATLRPPRPLIGKATFRGRAGRDPWRSTIRVPLLGAAPLRTDGPGFGAALQPEYQFD
jgi:hypothetical protein